MPTETGTTSLSASSRRHAHRQASGGVSWKADRVPEAQGERVVILGMKILIVDDAKFQRSNLSKVLKEAGYEVIQATNGREALDQLSEAPAAVICDLLMPDLDGFGFLEELRTKDHRPPVVIASADIQQSSRDRCVELGAACFVGKPYKPADILRALESVVSDLKAPSLAAAASG